MSVPNSSGGESEALRRAQRAHEPSMEEILASIRAIIADDRQADAAKAAPPAAPALRAVPPSGPQIVYSKEVATPKAQENAPAMRASLDEPVEPPAGNVVWARPPAAPEPAEAVPEVVAEAEAELPNVASLLSDEANRAVAASFSALSSTVAMQSSETIERLTREMLRPMVKSWLDENLPSLVERLVRAEIQRVARGGR